MSWLHELRALQDADGCFPSTVSLPGGTVADRNGFVTALVVRALRDVPAAEWSELRGRALTFLWTCRSTAVPGAFAFWPDATRPPWASTVPADADDTAIMLQELVRHGWFDRTGALRSIAAVLLPHRVAPAVCATLPPWVRAGSFYTWVASPETHPARRMVNIVDCCVNANVAALLSYLDARHFSGYQEAVRTVQAGVDWAGDNPVKLSSLIPFYPSGLSLVEAVEHAVACGAAELASALDHLRSLPAPLLDTGAGVCRSAYGRTVWRSTAVDCLRHVRTHQRTVAC